MRKTIRIYFLSNPKVLALLFAIANIAYCYSYVKGDRVEIVQRESREMHGVSPMHFSALPLDNFNLAGWNTSFIAVECWDAAADRS